MTPRAVNCLLAALIGLLALTIAGLFSVAHALAVKPASSPISFPVLSKPNAP